MKAALIIYLLGGCVVALRRAWQMYSKLDNFDWEYGRVWYSFFSGVILWPIRILFITPLLEPSNQILWGNWSSRDHREKEKFRSDPPPCGALIRYRQDDHGSCGEFVLDSKDLELFYQKAQKENSFFRGEAVAILLHWLQQRNPALGDATELPHFFDKRLPPLASFRVVIHDLVKTGHGKVWCPKCGQTFLPTELVSEDDMGKPGWNYERLCCPQHHLLLASENTFCEPARPRFRHQANPIKSDDKKDVQCKFGKANDAKPITQPDYVSCEQYLASERLADLTPDERQEVWRGFGPARGRAYLSNHVDSILGASSASTLCNLATGMMREVMDLESDRELQADIKADDKESQEMLHELNASRERSLWLARKATELYPHPVLFARLVKLLEAAGKNEAANKARELHAKQKATWTSKYTDEFLLMSLNPE